MEAVYSLIGVALGAIVAILSPIIVEWLRERGRTKRLLYALLAELEYNEYTARTAEEQNLTLGYLNKAFDTSCYRQARESGALVNLPPAVMGDLMNAYDRVLRLAILLGGGRGEALPREMIKATLLDWPDVQSKFKTAADGLRQCLSVSKKPSQANLERA